MLGPTPIINLLQLHFLHRIYVGHLAFEIQKKPAKNEKIQAGQLAIVKKRGPPFAQFVLATRSDS